MGAGSGGQDERRIEVFVKIQKKIYLFFFFFLGGGVGSGDRVGGVRVDVNREVKFL